MRIEEEEEDEPESGRGRGKSTAMSLVPLTMVKGRTDKGELDNDSKLSRAMSRLNPFESKGERIVATYERTTIEITRERHVRY